MPTHIEAMEKARLIDKKLDAMINECRTLSCAYGELGLPNLQKEFHAQAENYTALQLITSRMLAIEFQKNATSGKPFVSPSLLDCFTPMDPFSENK